MNTNERKGIRRRGAFLVEAAVAVVLMAALLAVTSRAVIAYRDARARFFGRHSAAWAAEAQFERIRAGADPASEPPAGLLADNVRVAAEVVPGTGCWSGLSRLTVTATWTPRRGRPVQETVRGYLDMEKTP